MTWFQGELYCDTVTRELWHGFTGNSFMILFQESCDMVSGGIVFRFIGNSVGIESPVQFVNIVLAIMLCY